MKIYKTITWLTSQLTMRIAAETTAALIAAGVGLAGTGASVGFQGVRGRKNREAQEKFNAQQQANWEKSFNYQKYINENQYQIQAKDQIAAGINPVAANGGSLSGFSASAGGQATTSDPIALDTGSLAQIGLQMAQLKHDSQERAKDRETQKDIAEINAETSRYGTDTQATIAAENRKTQKEIADNANENQKTIAKLNIESQQKIADWSNKTQKELQKAQQDWTDSENHAQAAKRLQEALEDAYNYGRELEAMKHLYVTEDGDKYRLDDYIKMLEADAIEYENSPTRRSEDAIYRGVDRLIKILTLGRSDSGSERSERSERRDSRSRRR